MNIREWKLDEITTISATKVNFESIKKALLASNGGVVFIVWQDDILIGACNIDFFQQWEEDDDITKYCNPRYPVIIEGKSYKEQYSIILSKNIYAGMVPIIDNSRKLRGAVSATDDTWLLDREKALDYLYFLKRKNVDIAYYFEKNKYKKIAFWGINKVSLSMAAELRHASSIDVVGVFDNVHSKVSCAENLLNYETSDHYVDSIEELQEYQIDLLIIADWRFRHLCNLGDMKTIYFNVLLSNGFKKVIALYFKEKLVGEGVEVYSVKIPTKEDLQIPEKPEMNLEKRLKWFSKETGLGIDSDEMALFNKERRELPKNEIKNNGLCYFGDTTGTYFNVMQKHRIVLNTPSQYTNTIYLIGPCIVMGLYNMDTCTLGYYLQEMLNEKTSYRTIPIGIPNDADRYFDYKMIKSLEVMPGDKIYWVEQSYRMEEFDLDMTPIFEKAYELFGDDMYYDAPVHCGKYLQKKCAQIIYEHLCMKKIPQSVCVGGVETRCRPLVKREKVLRAM